MPKFHMIIAKKYFPQIFGANVPFPPSPTPIGLFLALRAIPTVQCRSFEVRMVFHSEVESENLGG